MTNSEKKKKKKPHLRFPTIRYLQINENLDRLDAQSCRKLRSKRRHWKTKIRGHGG